MPDESGTDNVPRSGDEVIRETRQVVVVVEPGHRMICSRSCRPPPPTITNNNPTRPSSSESRPTSEYREKCERESSSYLTLYRRARGRGAGHAHGTRRSTPGRWAPGPCQGACAGRGSGEPRGGHLCTVSVHVPRTSSPFGLSAGLHYSVGIFKGVEWQCINHSTACMTT